MNLRLVSLLLLALIGKITAHAATPPLPAATFQDVTYGPYERNRLDVWQAKANAPTPLVIFIHGGGWHGGDKSALPLKLLDFLLAHGVSVASINYRYTDMAPLPAPVHDAARAVQFLRTKAPEWKLDPSRFGAYGISAGGCTVLWLAYHDDLADPRSPDPVARQSSRLQAAVGGSPQTCLEPAIVTAWVGDQVLQHPMIVRAVGAKSATELKPLPAEWAKLLREFSPINHVTHDDPPVLLTYPRIDPLPAANPGSAIHHATFGMKLKEKAEAAGIECILRIEDQKPDSAIPKPEDFLLQRLQAK